MKKFFIGALTLSAGCFIDPGPGTVCTTTTTSQGATTFCSTNFPADPAGIPVGTPDYSITAGAGVAGAPFGAYKITTNGQGDWFLGWQSDGIIHDFDGDVFCPDGCVISAGFANQGPLDGITQFGPNHLRFHAESIDPNFQQTVTFSTDGQFVQPVYFSLTIDGFSAAFNPADPNSPYVTFFPSAGREAIADIMPFSLIVAGTVFEKNAKITPSHAAPPHAGPNSATLSAPAPRSEKADKAASSQVVEASAK